MKDYKSLCSLIKIAGMKKAGCRPLGVYRLNFEPILGHVGGGYDAETIRLDHRMVLSGL